MARKGSLLETAEPPEGFEVIGLVSTAEFSGQAPHQSVVGKHQCWLIWALPVPNEKYFEYYPCFLAGVIGFNFQGKPKVGQFNKP